MARILMCEDSKSQALNLRLILESRGHEVVWAEDGQAGLDQLKGGTFDLLISDVQMPSMTGFELCRAIRDDDVLKSLPIILMTTLKEMQDLKTGHDVGANMYIVKPFDPEDLIRRMSRFVTSEPPKPADPPNFPFKSPPSPTPAPPAPVYAPPPAPPEPVHHATYQQAPPPASWPGNHPQAPVMPSPTAPMGHGYPPGYPPLQPTYAPMPPIIIPSLPPGQTGVAAARTLLSAIINVTEQGMERCHDPVIAGVLEGIRQIAHQAVQVCSDPATGGAPGGRVLLLIEPAESLKNALQTNLEKQGYPVRAVNSAITGINACNALGSSVSIVVAEATVCSSEVLAAVTRANPSAKVLCLVDEPSSGKAPPDLPAQVATIMRPFTFNRLLTAITELEAR